MGDELGNSTDIDRLLWSSGLSTPKSTLIESDDLKNCHMEYMPKSRQKTLILSFLGYLRKIESDPQNAWTCVYICCARESVLPIFKSRLAAIHSLHATIRTLSVFGLTPLVHYHK